MKRFSLLLTYALGCLLAAISVGHAQIAITNGDFAAEPAGDAQTDVTGWFDYDGSGLDWWQQTSSDANAARSPFPEASSYLFLSGAVADSNYWAYQSIGTNSEALTSLPIQFDVGTLVDAAGNLNRTIIVSLYQSDGTFVGTQNVDVEGAEGATLIDSFSVETGALAQGEAVTMSGELDLSLADGTNELFLRIANESIGGGQHYAGIDNIGIVDPERFSIVQHPVGVVAWVGEEVVFNSKFDSAQPFTIQWEVWTTSDETWTEIAGANSESYTVAAAALADDRNQYRAVAHRDSDDMTLTTDAATLRVGDPAAPTPANVVAHYRFEGGSAGSLVTAAIDSSGNGHDLEGAVIGEPAYSASVPSQRLPQTGEDNHFSLDLTGGDYALQGIDDDSLSGIEWTDFTIEAWVNFANVGNWQTIVGRDDRGDQNSDPHALFYFQKAAGNYLRFAGSANNGSLLVIDSNFSFTADTWTHVAVVGDAGAGTVTLYGNGSPVGSVQNYDGLLKPSDPNPHWTIGRGQYGGDTAQGDWVNGQIDEVRFTSAALSPTEFLNASNAVLNFTFEPVDIETPAGLEVEFSALAGGGGVSEVTYQWQVLENGSEIWTSIDGAASPTYLIEFPMVSQDGNQYRVVASRDGNSETSVAATLSVPGYPTPNIIKGLGAGQLAFSGDHFSFEVEASGVGNLTYQWQRDGGDLDGKTGASLDLGIVDGDSAGAYSVTITDDAALGEGLEPVSVTLSTELVIVQRPSAAISLNFVGASSDGGVNPAFAREPGVIEPHEAAGVVAVANWNNSPTGSLATQETPMSLVNDLGEATGAAATWGSANTWGTRMQEGGLAEKDADQRIFHGYIESRDGSTVTVTGIPYTTYDVYVYPVGVEGGPGEFIRSVTLADGGGTETTLYGRNYGGTNPMPPIPYQLATATSEEEAEASGTATFFRFPGVSGSSVTITHADVSGWNLGGIGGISIVDTTEGTPARPVIASRPSGVFVPAGGNAALSVSAESVNPGGSLSYQWHHDGAEISGATDPTLTLDAASSGESGTYTVVVSETSDLGPSANEASVPVVVVDSARPALISADMNWGTHEHMSGHGSLRTDGFSTENIGEGDTMWNRLGEGLLVPTYGNFKDADGFGLSGVTFTITGATGIANVATGGGIDDPVEDWSGPLLRDYVFTQDEDVMNMTIDGLEAFAGREVVLVVYAIGQNSASWPGPGLEDVDENDVATVTLAAQNSLSGEAESGVTGQAQGRDLRYNAQAYVSFDAVVAWNGTLSWTVGAVPGEPGVNAFNGFQLLVTDGGDGTPPPTGLLAWRQLHFGTTDDSGDAALTADPDGDGFRNLLEYALGSDPNQAGDAIGSVDMGEEGGFLTLTFAHIDDPSLTYEIEATDDVAVAWTVIGSYDGFTTVGEETFTDTVNDAARRFLRLRVRLN